MMPKYSKKDAEDFNKLINRYITNLKSPEFLNRYYAKSSNIILYLDNQEYTKYIIQLALLIDSVVTQYDTLKNKLYLEKIVTQPLNEMPLYINSGGILEKIAVWRINRGV